MKGFQKCLNGHFFKEDSSLCPYCPINNRITRPVSFNANDLNSVININLQLDFAPDNTKRFININRKNRDLNLKNQIANFLDCEEILLPEEITVRTQDIDSIVESKLLKKNIVNLNSDDNILSGDYYLCDKSISSIIPDTLLTQILGKGSKLDSLYNDSYSYPTSHALESNTGVSHSYGNEEFQKLREEVETKKYLAISLQDNSVLVLGMSDREKYTPIKSISKFYSEDISIFDPTVVIKKGNEIVLEDDFNTNIFSKYLSDVVNDSDLSLYFKVSRQKVAVALISLFEKLSALHINGFVHCDLKPQNILSLKEGLTPFDPINVRNGEISAGMTANYCAPEQILTLPVSPATDIYNLGLIVLAVIDGILYGKTSNYVIPTGGTKVRDVKLLTEPMIYIDYNNTNFDKKEGISPWKSFLEKCLAFDDKKRFTSMDSFINEYRRLIDFYPLTNDIEFSPNFGSLSKVEIQGKFEVAWFV